jgi:hypothetical protein
MRSKRYVAQQITVIIDGSSTLETYGAFVLSHGSHHDTRISLGEFP